MGFVTIFAVDVKNGKVEFSQPDAWSKTLQGLDGKKAKLTIKEFKAGDSIRSLDANAYYWGVVVEILRNEFGFEKEELHDALGLMFRRDYTKTIPTIINTSTMSSQEFWGYIDRVRTWAAVEYQITIPDPNRVEKG